MQVGTKKSTMKVTNVILGKQWGPNLVAGCQRIGLGFPGCVPAEYDRLEWGSESRTHGYVFAKLLNTNAFCQRIRLSFIQWSNFFWV